MTKHTFTVKTSSKAKPVTIVTTGDWRMAVEIALHKQGLRHRDIHAAHVPSRIFSARSFKFSGDMGLGVSRCGTAWVKLVGIGKPKGGPLSGEGKNGGSCYLQSALGTVFHDRISRSTAWMSNDRAAKYVQRIRNATNQAQIDTIIHKIVA